MKRPLIGLIIGLGIVVTLAIAWDVTLKRTVPPITNFAECAAAGHPVMETYPRRCQVGDKTFVELTEEEVKHADLIKLDSPRAGDTVSSPLVITGQARGGWFFEAVFPVTLVNWDGLIIAEGGARAKSDWTTDDFVPFEATLNFIVDPNVYSDRGSLILQKDNPSGLPQYDDALEIPVTIK